MAPRKDGDVFLKGIDEMRVGGIFSGIGGCLLGQVLVGNRPIWAIERDSFCCDILRERFKSLQVIESDVRLVDFRRLEKVDGIVAGFPCQDISAAKGNGKGVEGERSGLWRQVIRAVDDLGPDWVFLENSPRIKGKGREKVIDEFVARGYSWKDGVLGAVDAGAPHKRDRWWFLAANTDGMRQLEQKRVEQDERGWFGHCFENDANTLCHRLQESVQFNWLQEADAEAIKTIEGLRKASPWNPIDAGPLRVVHGLSNRTYRIKALGNSQVPICHATAFELLIRK